MKKIRLGESKNFAQNERKKDFGDLTDMMSRNKMPHYIRGIYTLFAPYNCKRRANVYLIIDG